MNNVKYKDKKDKVVVGWSGSTLISFKTAEENLLKDDEMLCVEIVNRNPQNLKWHEKSGKNDRNC